MTETRKPPRCLFGLHRWHRDIARSEYPALGLVLTWGIQTCTLCGTEPRA